MKALYGFGLILAGMLAGCGLEPAVLAPEFDAQARRLSPLETLRRDAEREFQQRDTNHNGFISYGEFAKAVGFDENMTPENSYQVANFNIMCGGRLQDSKADLSEYTDVFVWNLLPATQSTRLERASDHEFLLLDRNHDILLDAREMEAFIGQQQDPQMTRRLAQDLDKKRNRADGKWDAGEFHNLKVWLAVLNG